MPNALNPVLAVQNPIQRISRLRDHIERQFCTSTLLFDHDGRHGTDEAKEPVEVLAVAQFPSGIEEVPVCADLSLVEGYKDCEEGGGSEGVECCL